MRLTQRQRIVRGAARVVVANGYSGLSIPAISGAAGVSNQTFYEQFDSKREAFLAAFEILASDAFEAAVGAYSAAGDRPEALGVGLRALLEHIAVNPLFARLAFFELPTAGPEALDRADAMLDSFTAFITPEGSPSGIAGVDSKAVLDAIASGIWALIQHEINEGRIEALPELAPEITRIALAPACA
jgi:AcrR family transcriptional regulator